MKTFKLISLQVVKDQGLMDITLDDGLIINKEDEHNTWLIEAYIPNGFYGFFQEAQTKKTELVVQVVITKKDNKPAPLHVKTRSVRKLHGHISVLLEGTIKSKKNNYEELLLNDLIQKGFTGADLLTEFRLKMQNKA